MKRTIFLINITCYLILMLAGCGGAISNTPERAVNDYFQSLNDNDCSKILELHSSNFRYRPGASKEEEFKACQEDSKRNHAETTIQIEGVSIVENRALVNGELAMIDQTKKITDKIIVRLIVEDGEWKLDKITYDDAPS